MKVKMGFTIINTMFYFHLEIIINYAVILILAAHSTDYNAISSSPFREGNLSLLHTHKALHVKAILYCRIFEVFDSLIRISN